jgi:hypothetical protein
LDESDFLMVLNENLIGGVRIMANDTVQGDRASAVGSESTGGEVSVLDFGKFL